MSLLSRVLELQRFALLAKTTMGDGGGAAILAQVDHLVACVPKMDVSLSDAIPVLEELRMPHCQLSASDVERVIKALNRKLSAGQKQKGTKASRQTHAFFHNYLTRDDWEVLLRENAPVESRLQIIASRALSIGLFHPNELTYVGMLSIVAVAVRELWTHEVAHVHLLSLKRELKKQRKIKILHEGRGTLLPTFQEAVEEWMAQMDVVGDYAPIECPVSQSLIFARQSNMAARKSHTNLRTGREQGQLASASPRQESLSDLIAQAAATAAALASSAQRALPSPVALPLPPTHPADGPPLPPPPMPPIASVAVEPHTPQPKGESARTAMSPVDCPPLTLDMSPCAISPPAQSHAGSRSSGCNDLDKVLADFSTIIERRTAKRLAAPTADPATIAPKRRRRTRKTPASVVVAAAPSTDLGRDVAAVAMPSTVDMAIVASPKATGEAAPHLALVPQVECRPPMMPTEVAAPMTYRGCKIYSSVKRRAWRVYPFPVDSVYDKPFYWKAGAETQWQKLLSYCESPTLPESRKKDVAKGCR